MKSSVETTRRFVPRAAQRGMTLIEIMVVVVIIGLVAGLVGTAVFNTLGEAKVNLAGTQIKKISDALDQYKLMHRRYPTTAEGLMALTTASGGHGPTMKSLPKDPWGNDYVYISPGVNNTGSFDLMSYGDDGIQSADDITNWSSGGEQ